MVSRPTLTAKTAIVIAGNGMSSGGRIVNYRKAMMQDERHDVVLVGYEAEGAPGRAVQGFWCEYGYVEMDGQLYDISAQVHTIGGYSAHANQGDLLRFVTGMRHWPTEFRIVHGEDAAKQALANPCIAHTAQTAASMTSILSA